MTGRYPSSSQEFCGILQKRFDEAISVLKRLYPTGEGKAEYEEVASAEAEHQQEGHQTKTTAFLDILATKERRMALTAGVGIQVEFFPLKSVYHDIKLSYKQHIHDYD